jgi:hypothetical protein
MEIYNSTTSSAMVVQELHERVRRTRRKPICERHRVENTEKYFAVFYPFLIRFNPFHHWFFGIYLFEKKKNGKSKD